MVSWTPAHRGIPPNEAADAAANLARTEGEVTALGLPPSAFYSAQLRLQREGWQNDWTQAQVGRHLHNLQPLIPVTPWFARSDAERRVITTIIRLRIGHARTPLHLWEKAGAEDHLCPHCGEEMADAAHLIDICLFIDRLAFQAALTELGVEDNLHGVISAPAKAAPAMPLLLRSNPLLRL